MKAGDAGQREGTMTIIKTPEEIAATAVPWDGSLRFHRSPLSWDEIEVIVADAIRSDRAQLSGDLETFATAAAHWVTELQDSIIPGATNDGLAERLDERDEIQAALACYREMKENG